MSAPKKTNNNFHQRTKTHDTPPPTSSKDEADKQDVPILTCGRAKGTNNNWQVFVEKMSNRLGAEFGVRGTFIDHDGEPQQKPPPKYPRYIDIRQEDIDAAPQDFYDPSSEEASAMGIRPPIMYATEVEE